MIKLFAICSMLFTNPQFDSQVAAPGQIKFYYKNAGKELRYLPEIQKVDPSVVYSTNIQMFSVGPHWKSYTPVGLYIEKGKQLYPMRRVNNPRYNFGMQPQCVFAITKSTKAIMVSVNEARPGDYYYAVELAPMLVINSRINPKLTKSESRYIRNGVGILKDGRVLFVISKTTVTFQEMAAYFLSQGCVSASYVDGAVSEVWRPGETPEFPGEFAVMAGVSKN
jgi:uncharacterized protein YigE (DUF2233 family)